MATIYTVSPSFKIGSTSYDVLDATFDFDPELIEVMSNASFYPDYTIGNLKVQITVKTNDYNLAAIAFKGSEHADAAITLKGAHSDALEAIEAYTFGTGSAEYKISNTRVTEKVSIGGSADKKNSEFSITFTAARNSITKADPTLTVTSTFGED